ncbi:MFS transporter [Microbacterium sp.]|uniref:MFS transporter n=1 Tax=Microbacterium sp. TaxID=51671 RepID=UPI003A8F3150
MTTTQRSAAKPGGGNQKLRTAIAAGVGAAIENYDFAAFGTASALYLGAAFFSAADPIMGTLMAFLTFGVGFLARPFGGVVGGHLGDRYGRKPVLVMSLIVMGSSTFAMGLLPTYAQIGVLAPILLVTVRLIQGLAYGAEWGGAVMMTFEHAPRRQKGVYSAVPQAGTPTGIALATVVFLFSVQLGGEWAWRVPFLASAVLIGVGIFIRLKIEESPDFEEAKGKGEILASPVKEAVSREWATILRIIALRLVESCGYYVVATFLLSHIKTNHPDTENVTLIALLLAATIAIPMVIVSGALSDRFGRKRVYMFGVLASIAFGFPMFMLTNGGNELAIILVFVIGISVIWASVAGVQGAWFGELFPTNTRTSGVSLGYQLAASIAGFSPFIVGVLTAALGWIGGSTFYVLIAVIGLIGVVATRETWRGGKSRLTGESEVAKADQAREIGAAVK